MTGIVGLLALALCCSSAAAFLLSAKLPPSAGRHALVSPAPRLRGSLATSLRASTASPATNLPKSQDAEGDVPVEHRGIPTEHKGLHSTLYGDGDDHGATEDLKIVEFDGVKMLSVIDFLTMADGAKESAVFALYGEDGKTCNYINFARDVVPAVTAECLSHGDEASKIRVKTVKFPKRTILEDLKKEWLGELDYVPVGNQEATAWGRKVGEMSTEQRHLHEERKFKLRKAMADTALIDEMEEIPEEEKFRRANLQMAVEGDDWSGEIDKQTSETIQPRAVDESIHSPFEGGANVADHQEAAPLPFTKEAIDAVLDEVRPYLIADGGNCRVVSVDKETGDVQLQLEGACGTCPSATVTMKQGIERVLRENFGSRLGEVTQVQPSVVEKLSVEMVEQILAPVRPAVEGLGGSVKVLNLDPVTGIVTLAYSGPDKLTYGIELTLMDNPMIKKVTFEKP